jgi:hypothetical protein
MQPLRQTVDVIMERIPLQSRWASERWQPAAVDIAACAQPGPVPNRVPGTNACVRESENRWRCQGFEIELHRTEAEGYFLNITAPDPRIFVLWRMFDDGVAPAARPVLLTVSYNEAGRFMDAGEQVDGVSMLPPIAEWMRAFIAVHYKPEPRRKVKRNDPLGDEAAGRERGRRE